MSTVPKAHSKLLRGIQQAEAQAWFLFLAFYCLIFVLFKERNMSYIIHDVHKIIVIITVALRSEKYSSSKCGQPCNNFLLDQEIISMVTHLIKISSKFGTCPSPLKDQHCFLDF